MKIILYAICNKVLRVVKEPCTGLAKTNFPYTQDPSGIPWETTMVFCPNSA